MRSGTVLFIPDLLKSLLKNKNKKSMMLIVFTSQAKCPFLKGFLNCFEHAKKYNYLCITDCLWLMEKKKI